jgi:hypothetical protein
MTASGLVWVSTSKVTVGLVVENGVVVDAPPYARRWALGRRLAEVWPIPRSGMTVKWLPASDRRTRKETTMDIFEDEIYPLTADGVPPDWETWGWPSWVPLGIAGQIVDCFPSPRAWVADMLAQNSFALGATVKLPWSWETRGAEIIGRWVHGWGCLGFLVRPDGSHYSWWHLDSASSYPEIPTAAQVVSGE